MMDFFDRRALAKSIRDAVVLRTKQSVSSEVVSVCGDGNPDGFSDSALVPRFTIHCRQDCTIRVSIRSDAILIETPKRLGSRTHSTSIVSVDEGIGGRMVLGQEEGLIVDRIVASIADFRLRAAKSELREARERLHNQIQSIVEWHKYVNLLREREAEAASDVEAAKRAELSHDVVEQGSDAMEIGNRPPEL